MNRRLKYGFAGLVLSQAAHSIEEYRTQLWEVFAPARYVSGLFSSDLETGFLIINISLNLIGLLFLVFVILPERRAAIAVLIFWIGLELMNGIVHLTWAFSEGQYVSGSLTAPLLLAFAIYLMLNLRREKKPAL